MRVSVCAAIHFPVSLRLLSDCCLNIEHARMSDVPFPGSPNKIHAGVPNLQCCCECRCLESHATRIKVGPSRYPLWHSLLALLFPSPGLCVCVGSEWVRVRVVVCVCGGDQLTKLQRTHTCATHARTQAQKRSMAQDTPLSARVMRLSERAGPPCGAPSAPSSPASSPAALS